MRKKGINVVMERDKQILTALAMCGTITLDYAHELVGEKRIKSYCKEKLFTVAPYIRNKKEYFGVQLTKAGEQYVAEKMGIKDFYKSSSKAHDVIMEKIHREASVKGIKRIVTEQMQREQINLKIRKFKNENNLSEYRYWSAMRANKKIAPCDVIVIYEDGSVQPFEAVTRHYTNAMKNQREEFCKLCEYERPRFIS